MTEILGVSICSRNYEIMTGELYHFICQNKNGTIFKTTDLSLQILYIGMAKLVLAQLKH